MNADSLGLKIKKIIIICVYLAKICVLCVLSYSLPPSFSSVNSVVYVFEERGTGFEPATISLATRCSTN